MVTLLLIPGFAGLNHARGGGAWFGISAVLEKLPGRTIFYAAPLAAESTRRQNLDRAG